MTIRDRTFWREVATAGGLVAVIGGIVAVITGLTASPFYVYGWVILVSGGLLSLFAGIVSGYLARTSQEERGEERKG